jgi:two-component system KDP operon response regulator KdpE
MNNEAEILVIDDESQIRKLLDITLRTNGYRVNEAQTAREGLVRAANHPPDLILLDIGLPDGNGHDVLMKLREWYTNPVIVLSVQSSEEDIVRALDNGADDYLVKPISHGVSYWHAYVRYLEKSNRMRTTPYNFMEIF